MKKSDLMRNLIGSKNPSQTDIKAFEEEKPTTVDAQSIEIIQEEVKKEEKSDIIQYIKKKIIKIRN